MASVIEFPTADQVRGRLSYKPETGEFVWTARGRGIRVGFPAGTLQLDGRREITIFGRRHKAARLAWLYVHGVWPSGVIDHINGNPADDRIENLRDTTHQENIQNQHRAQRSNKSSKLLGVALHHSGSWQARIAVKGKNLYLGSFKTPEEAHQAYVAAKRSMHSGCKI